MTLNRRELLGRGAALGAAVAVGRVAVARAAQTERLDFGALGPRDGWPGWTCHGVANLRCAGGHGYLEAASDVFPCDPRPVAFAVDRRFRDGQIAATATATGAGTGLVLRRVGPRTYYAALLDDEERALVILRRAPDGVHQLARAPIPLRAGPTHLVFAAHGTQLVANVQDDLGRTELAVRDWTPALQHAGDPGVLATARTLFPSAGPEVLPALGNLHLLPYGVQEGQAVMKTAVGEAILNTIRERSTAAFTTIELRAADGFEMTVPSVIAATNGPPARGGARLRVATDVPARLQLEVADNPRFHHARRVKVGVTGDFAGAFGTVRGLRPGRQAYWRPRVRRHGRETVGPVQSFRVPPRAGSSAAVKVAIGACAAQFGPAFDLLAHERPDVFVWQGDLNYPDTIGPFAQSMAGYAGIWRDFLANPRMAPLLSRSLFVAQRDDHDYGVQDANSTNLVPWGLAPWEALMERRNYFRFTLGLAELWVLDQRRFKSDPTKPDTTAKSLIGPAQRQWLFDTLARSRAPLKVICSPCTLSPVSGNSRDGSWATGFTAERDALLDHIHGHVSGRCVFVTGDTHWTLVYDTPRLFEARPCPLGIPTPNDITITDPQVAENARGSYGVAYADDNRGHFALLEVSGTQGSAHLDLTLVRDDGARPYRKRFTVPR